MTISQKNTGIIIVDHGSRRQESNDMLELAVAAFRQQNDYTIVEPAHMELARPDIESAFADCVRQGAERVVVFPYFLSPGRHWSEDIPKLVEAAAADFPNVAWLITAPFGLHSAMSSIISDRIDHCLEQASSGEHRRYCDACDSDTACRLHAGR